MSRGSAGHSRRQPIGAAAAGVKERMAKYWLAGTHEVSLGGRLALMRLLGL